MTGGAGRLGVAAGMASYLDAGVLVASGLSIGGFYVDSLSLSNGEVGVLLGLQTLSFAAGAMTGGRLSDRWGRRTVLIASLALYAVGVALLAVAWGPSALAVGVVLTGLAIGADLPSSLALISEEAPHGHKGRMVVLSQLLWVLGIGLTGMLAVLVAGLGSLAGRILYAHLFVVAVVVLLARLSIRESREWTEARRGGRGRHRRPATGSDPRNPPQRRTAATAPAVLAIGAFYVLWNLGANTIGQFRPFIWIHVMNGGERAASALVLLSLPLGLAGGLLFLRVVDTARRDVAVVCGLLVSGAGWLTVTLSPTPEAFVLAVVCFVLGGAVAGEATYKVWAQELAPTLVRATYQGSTMAVARLVATAFATVTPALVTANPQAFFGTVLAAHLIAAAIAVMCILRLGGSGRRQVSTQG